MIKAVLWDIDGTLLDFKAAEKNAIRKCFEIFSLGSVTDEMIARYSEINVTYWERLERGEMEKSAILVGRFAEFLSEYGLDSALASAFNAEFQERLGDTVVFFPTAEETVKLLKARGIYQCAVTNGTLKVQRRKLAVSGLDTLLDDVFISEIVGVEKPGRGFFDFVLSDIPQGLSKSEILIVGDSVTSDMKGGFDCGIKTCLFSPDGVFRSSPFPIDHKISEISEVIGLL